jgi:hypothetical protein
VAEEASDAFDPDRVLETLNRHGVEYLLVGGLAARAHGAERQTSDVDCVSNTTVENLERIAAAPSSWTAVCESAGCPTRKPAACR